MAYQPLEKLLPKSSTSIFKLVILASKRATELADGHPKLIDFPSAPKVTTVALDEIMEGKVELATEEQAKKLKEQRAKEEKTKAEKPDAKKEEPQEAGA